MHILKFLLFFLSSAFLHSQELLSQNRYFVHAGLGFANIPSPAWKHGTIEFDSNNLVKFNQVKFGVQFDYIQGFGIGVRNGNYYVDISTFGNLSSGLYLGLNSIGQSETGFTHRASLLGGDYESYNVRTGINLKYKFADKKLGAYFGVLWIPNNDGIVNKYIPTDTKHKTLEVGLTYTSEMINFAVGNVEMEIKASILLTTDKMLRPEGGAVTGWLLKPLVQYIEESSHLFYKLETTFLFGLNK